MGNHGKNQSTFNTIETAAQIMTADKYHQTKLTIIHNENLEMSERVGNLPGNGPMITLTPPHLPLPHLPPPPPPEVHGKVVLELHGFSLLSGFKLNF